MGRDVARITAQCDRSAPGAARAALAELPDIGPVLGDAMLVASELVTNAVQHSLCTEEELLTVVLRREDDHLRISVRDRGRSGGTAQIADDPYGFRGLGLKVVDQLAVRWGCERHHQGYEVWADLPLSQAATRN